MCPGGDEDCMHPFFKCPFAKTIWTKQSITSVDATLEATFGTQSKWAGIGGGERGGKEKRERGGVSILLALWVFRLHRNEMFLGGGQHLQM